MSGVRDMVAGEMCVSHDTPRDFHSEASADTPHTRRDAPALSTISSLTALNRKSQKNDR